MPDSSQAARYNVVANSHQTGRDRPPGPPGLPLLGNTLSFIRDPIGFHERCRDEYGDLASADVAGNEFWFVMHPALIRQVLVDDDARYEKGTFVERSIGSIVEEGLFLAEGESWRWQRKLLQPAFYREHIVNYADDVVDVTTQAAEQWLDGEHLHVDRAMKDITLEVLVRTLFGTDLSPVHEDAIEEASRAVIDRMDASSGSVFVPEWVPTPTNRRYRGARDRFASVIDDLVSEREAQDLSGRSDLLSILVAASEDEPRLTPQRLRDEMLTFLFAGHETTALALTYTWYLLAHNPEKFERLRAELDDVLDGAQPTASDLDDLEYTAHVANESLRLYPPAPSFFREPTEPTELGDYTVEPGTNVALPQWVAHRDPRWWEAPDAFVPERWVGDSDRPEYAYFPFGGGPRHCIGMRFALMELKLVVATIAQKMRFEPTGAGLDLDWSITLQPHDGVFLRVRRD